MIVFGTAHYDSRLQYPLEGIIWIPKDGVYTFQVDTNGDTCFLFIDSEPVLKYRAGRDSEHKLIWERAGNQYKSIILTSKVCQTQSAMAKAGDSKLSNISLTIFKAFRGHVTGIFGGLDCGLQ